MRRCTGKRGMPVFQCTSCWHCVTESNFLRNHLYYRYNEKLKLTFQPLLRCHHWHQTLEKIHENIYQILRYYKTLHRYRWWLSVEIICSPWSYHIVNTMLDRRECSGLLVNRQLKFNVAARPPCPATPDTLSGVIVRVIGRDFVLRELNWIIKVTRQKISSQH